MFPSLIRAIECAVGTGHKVNPALLTPQYETAQILRRLAPAYGSNVVLSGTVHAILSSSVQNHCRLVDALGGNAEFSSVARARGVGDEMVFVHDTWDWRVMSRPPFMPNASAAPGIAVLPSFATIGSANITEADVFNLTRATLPERDRCISLLGEADIIDHPVAKAVYDAKVGAAEFDLIL